MSQPLPADHVEKKVNDGWIHARMIIEVLAISKEAAESALEKHVQGLRQEKRTRIIKEQFHDSVKVQNPNPNLSEGWSQIVEIEYIAQDFDELVYVVMNYAPSSIELIAPSELNISIGEAQGFLTSLAGMIHKFASMGIGGVVVRS